MSTQQVNTPVQFLRQYAGSLDIDERFETTAARTAYLTSPRRWAGMEVADSETGKRYILNATKDAWKQVWTADDFNIADYVAKAGSEMSGSLLMSGGASIDSAVTAGSDILNLGTANADIINIGYSGSVININGTAVFQNTDNLSVKDKLIRLNVGGSAASAISTGFEIEEASAITGWFATNASRNGWDFKAPASYQLSLGLDLLTADRVIKMPNSNGTLALISDLTGGYVPLSRTLTINGTTQDLSLNRTWNVGTVTSIGISTPTGLSVSNTPITTSGTIAIALQSGYSIPTTALQANWNTAYAWGNHAGLYYTLGSTVANSTQFAGIGYEGSVLNTPSGFMVYNPTTSRWGYATTAQVQGYLGLGSMAYENTSSYYTTTQIQNFFSGASAMTGYNKSNWDAAYGWGNWASGSHYIGTTLIANNRASGAQTLTGVNIDGNAYSATYWGGFAANFNVAATTMDYLMVRESGAGIMKVGSAALVASFLSGQTMNIIGNASTATNVAASGVTGGAALSLTDDTNITITQTGSTTALLAAKGLIMGWTGTLADARITSSGNWNTAYSYSQIGHLPLSGGNVTGRTIFAKSAQTSYSTAALEVYTADGGETGISFHRGGVSAGFLSHGSYGGLRWNGTQLVIADGSTYAISISGNAATASYATLADGASKLWSISHNTAYYITNTWNGSYWRISSNHPSGVSVEHATLWNGVAINLSSEATAPEYITTFQGGVARYSTAATIRTYLGSPVYYAGFTLDANTMPSNSDGFSYSVNAPYTGPIVNLGALNYEVQFSAAYTSSNIGFRTRNGDAGTWNGWKNILHESNFTSYAYAIGSTVANSTLWNGYAINLATYGSNAGDFLNYDNSLGIIKPFSTAQIQTKLGLTASVWVDLVSSQTISGVKTFSNTIYAGATGGNIFLTGTTHGQVSVSGSTLYLADWATGTKGLTINLTTGNAVFGNNLSAAGGYFSELSVTNPNNACGWLFIDGTQVSHHKYSISNQINGVSNSGLQIRDETAGVGLLNFSTSYDATFGAGVYATLGNFSSSVYASGFVKASSSDSYFLLGAGGHVPTSYYFGLGNTNSISGTNYYTGNPQYFYSDRGSGTLIKNLSNPSLQVYSTDSGPAFMSFHRAGQYAVNMGLEVNSGDHFVIGGWSVGAVNRFDLNLNTGNLLISGGITAGGDINTGANAYFGDYLFLNSKLALRGTDTYLRLNQNGEFAGGIYTPYNLRIEGTTTFGSGTYYISGSAANLPATTIASSLTVNGPVYPHYIQNQSSVGTDNNFGIFFGTYAEGSDYVIRKRAGSWTAPYQPLDIKFYTGIRIGADFNYGGTIFYSSSNLATALFSVGSYDTNIRMHVGGQKLLLYSTGIGTEVEALQASYFGYSYSYPVLQIGDTRANRSIAFGVDLTGNPSGSFSGGGSEYIWKNVGKFITPNSINNGYNTLFSWNASGQITVNGYLNTLSGLQVDGDIYLGARSAWLSAWLNQALKTTDAPTFANVTATNFYGNATTATSTTLLSSLGQYVWTDVAVASTYPVGIQNSFVSAAEGFTSYGSVMTMRTYSGGGGGTLQLYAPYGSVYGGTSLRFRTSDYNAGDAWNSWKIIMDSSNITSYTAGSANNVFQNTDPASSTYRLLLGNGTNTNAPVYNYSSLYWNQSTNTIHNANITGSADYLGGRLYDTYLGKFGNTYYQATTWIQIAPTVGLYNADYGSHLLPSQSAYGAWQISGARGAYGGIYDAYSGTWWMHDSGGNGGEYDNSGWITYWNKGLLGFAIGASTVQSGYKLTVNGSLYTSGNIANTGGIYPGSWIYSSSKTGLYNSTYSGYFYQTSPNYWVLTSAGSSTVGMQLRDGFEGSIKGYLYADTGGFGLLTSGGSWVVRTNGSSDNQLYGIWGVNMAPSGSYTLQVGGTIGASGAVTASTFYKSSDIRLKKVLGRSGDMIIYKWLDGRDNLVHYGYSAQEVEQYMPDQVTMNGEYRAVDYTEVLVKKVNDLEKEVKLLREKLNGGVV